MDGVTFDGATPRKRLQYSGAKSMNSSALKPFSTVCRNTKKTGELWRRMSRRTKWFPLVSGASFNRETLDRGRARLTYRAHLGCSLTMSAICALAAWGALGRRTHAGGAAGVLRDCNWRSGGVAAIQIRDVALL